MADALSMSIHYSENDLRAIVPALFPAGRPCGNFGKPTCRVSVHERGKHHTVGGASFRLCDACRTLVEVQAAEAGLAVNVEAL